MARKRIIKETRGKVSVFPQIVGPTRSGKPWVITTVPKMRSEDRLSAKVDLESGEFIIPMDESLAAGAVRTHELSHVCFTPAIPKKQMLESILPPDKAKWFITHPFGDVCLQIVEDCRVNALALKHKLYPKLREGIYDSVGILIDQIIRQIRFIGKLMPIENNLVIIFTALYSIFRGRPKSKLGKAVKCLFELAEERKGLNPKVKEIRTVIGKALETHLYPDLTFQGTVLAALEILEADLFTADGVSHMAAHGLSGRLFAEVPEVEEKDRIDFSGSTAISTDFPVIDAVAEIKRYIKEHDASNLKVTMRVVNLTPRSFRKRVGHGVKRTFIDAGVVPRFVFRFPWGPVFSRKVITHAGGSMLVDDSGSMGLSPSELLSIMRDAPMGTVGMYSGKGKSGVLRVPSYRGRTIEATLDNIRKFRAGGGNIVDHLALGWLLAQPAPRIWVCDGGVTGAYDRPNHLVDNLCNSLMKKGNVKRVGGVKECLELLKARKKYHRIRGKVSLGYDRKSEV